jgi:hypothetical protein
MEADAEPVTVVCSLWRGWQPIYDYQHVNALGRMVAHFLPRARFVCFTDTPEGIEYETHPIPAAPPMLPSHRGRNCYWRMWFFSEECAKEFPGRIMNIDLDTLVLRDLSPLVTDHNFRILKAGVCPYNGGFWLHRTGTRPSIWRQLTRREVWLMRRDKRARRWVGSDQAWLAWKWPNAPLYTEADGCHYLMVYRPALPETVTEILNTARIVFFPGAPCGKPWTPEFASRYPAVHQAYMEWFG